MLYGIAPSTSRSASVAPPPRILSAVSECTASSAASKSRAGAPEAAAGVTRTPPEARRSREATGVEVRTSGSSVRGGAGRGFGMERCNRGAVAGG